MRISWRAKPHYIYINKEKTIKELKLQFLNEFGKPELFNSTEIRFLYNGNNLNNYYNQKVEIINSPIAVIDYNYLLNKDRNKNVL